MKMKIKNEIEIGNINFSNDKPFTLIGGINVIENADLTYKCAEIYKKICQKLSINLIFKASFERLGHPQIPLEDLVLKKA